MATLQWNEPIHEHAGTVLRVEACGWSRTKPRDGSFPRNYLKVCLLVSDRGQEKEMARRFYYNTEEERLTFRPLLEAIGCVGIMDQKLDYAIKHSPKDDGSVFDNIYINFPQGHPANEVKSFRQSAAPAAPAATQAPAAPPAVQPVTPAPYVAPVQPQAPVAPQQPVAPASTEDLPF